MARRRPDRLGRQWQHCHGAPRGCGRDPHPKARGRRRRNSQAPHEVTDARTWRRTRPRTRLPTGRPVWAACTRPSPGLSLNKRVCTATRTHAHTRTQAHTYMHSHIHTHTHVHTYMHHTHLCAHMHRCTHSHTYSRAHTRTHMNSHTRTHSRAHAQMHVLTHTHTRTLACTRTHPHTCRDARTHTRTLLPSSRWLHVASTSPEAESSTCAVAGQAPHPLCSVSLAQNLGQHPTSEEPAGEARGGPRGQRRVRGRVHCGRAGGCTSPQRGSGAGELCSLSARPCDTQQSRPGAWGQGRPPRSPRAVGSRGRVPWPPGQACFSMGLSIFLA